MTWPLAARNVSELKTNIQPDLCCPMYGKTQTSSVDQNPFKNLLWVDCSAGFLVGIAVLMLHKILSNWYGLPEHVLLFTGIANVLFASYSCSLAIRHKKSRSAILALIIANFTWVPVCLYLTAAHWATATYFGLGHLVLEAIFVGLLALLEWRFRDVLIG